MLLLPRSLSMLGARRGSALAALLVAAVTLAGCTSSNTQAAKQTKTFTGAEGAAQTVIADMATRAANTDAAGICSRDLAASAQATFAKVGGTCAKGVLKALDAADSLQLDVVAVKVSSAGAAQTAVAQIDTPDDIGTRSVTLTRASSTGLWKIASFGSTLTPKGKSTSTSTTTPADPNATEIPLTSP